MDIRPTTGSPAAADVAADLRTLADLVEGDEFMAAVIARYFDKEVWPSHAAGWEHERQDREVMAETIRRFKKIAAGPVKKEYQDSGEGYFRATVPLSALQLGLVELRAEVCERVVVGTETVTEEVPDPDYIAAAPTITQTREVEQVEWRCAPVLAPVEAGDQA